MYELEHLDMHGNDLKVGDWVRYPWWNGFVYEFHCGRVKMVSKHDPTSVWIRNTTISGVSTSRVCEKMPDNLRERKKLLLLRMLENPCVSDKNDFF